MAKKQSLSLNPQDHGSKGIFMTLFSSVLFLFVIGLFLLFSLHSENIINYFKENTNIVAELKSETNKINIKDIELILKNNPQIKPESVVYYSKEEALLTMKKMLGKNELLDEKENPFRGVYSFNVYAKSANDDDIASLIRELSRQNSIENVYAQTAYLGYWDTWKGKINEMAVIIGVVLLLIAISLIFNTIQLVIQSKKYAINLMELIGASWSFIRFPFYRRSFKYSVTSSIIASVLLGIVTIGMLIQFPSTGDYLNPIYLAISMLTMLVLALIIHLGSTHYLLNKFLKDH